MNIIHLHQELSSSSHPAPINRWTRLLHYVQDSWRHRLPTHVPLTLESTFAATAITGFLIGALTALVFLWPESHDAGSLAKLEHRLQKVERARLSRSGH